MSDLNTERKRRHFEIEEDEREENPADNRNTMVKFAILEAEDIHCYKEFDSHCSCGSARELHRAIEKPNKKNVRFLSQFFKTYSAEKIRALVSIPCQSEEHNGLTALHLALAIYNRADVVKIIAAHIFLNIYTDLCTTEEQGKLNVVQFCCIRGDANGFILLEEKISAPLLQQMLNEKSSTGIYKGYTAFDMLCLQANRYCEDLVVEEPTLILFDKLFQYNACSSRIMLTAEHINTLKSSGNDARSLIQDFCTILQSSALHNDNYSEPHQSIPPMAHEPTSVDLGNVPNDPDSSSGDESKSGQELAAVLLDLSTVVDRSVTATLSL